MLSAASWCIFLGRRGFVTRVVVRFARELVLRDVAPLAARGFVELASKIGSPGTGVGASEICSVVCVNPGGQASIW